MAMITTDFPDERRLAILPRVITKISGNHGITVSINCLTTSL